MSESLVGKLLIASTLAPPSVFSQSVCLIVHQDPDSIMGVLLNRPIAEPTEAQVQQWLGKPQDHAAPDTASDGDSEPMSVDREISVGRETPAVARPSGAMMHFGGPLSGPLLALHGMPQAAEAEAGAGLYVAAQHKHLEQLVQQHKADFRLIIGHSGWSNQQLHDELLAGYWHVLSATPENTLPVRDDLWPRLIRRATGASIASWVGARDTGGEVGLN